MRILLVLLLLPNVHGCHAHLAPLGAMRLRGGSASGRWGVAGRADAGASRHGNSGGGMEVLAPMAVIVLKKALGVALAFALFGLDRLPFSPLRIAVCNNKKECAAPDTRHPSQHKYTHRDALAARAVDDDGDLVEDTVSSAIAVSSSGSSGFGQRQRLWRPPSIRIEVSKFLRNADFPDISQVLFVFVWAWCAGVALDPSSRRRSKSYAIQRQYNLVMNDRLYVVRVHTCAACMITLCDTSNYVSAPLHSYTDLSHPTLKTDGARHRS